MLSAVTRCRWASPPRAERRADEVTSPITGRFLGQGSRTRSASGYAGDTRERGSGSPIRGERCAFRALQSSARPGGALTDRVPRGGCEYAGGVAVPTGTRGAGGGGGAITTPVPPQGRRRPPERRVPAPRGAWGASCGG